MSFSFSPKIVTDGLILYLDAANPNSIISGSTIWKDLTKNSYDGLLTNNPTFSSSNGGNLIFDGIDDYVGRTLSIDTGQNFSCFSWLKPGSINIRNAIVSNSYPYLNSTGWLLSTATNYSSYNNSFFVTIGIDQAYRVATNNSITQNKWNYVGFTITNGGQDIKLYVNGFETTYQVSSLNNIVIQYTTQEFYIGRRYSGNTEPFVGSIAITQIYNRVLSSHEILQNYNSLKTRFEL